MDPDYALFARIVEEGSLSAAGRAIGLSPAMVSKRLARLEQRLGAALVNRTTRRLALTEIGATFHRDVLAILKAAKEAEARVSGHRDHPSGLLRVSAPTSLGRLHIAPGLKDFLDAFPKVELDLELSDSFVDLMAERIDLAIRITSHVGASYASQRLTSNRRILCASPQYLAQSGPIHALADLPRQRLLAATDQMPWRLVDRGGRKASVDGASHVRTNSSEVVRELAIAGVGIALRSLWDIGNELAEGRLVRILPDWEGSVDVGIHAVWPRHRNPAPATAAFLDFLKTLLSADPLREA